MPAPCGSWWGSTDPRHAPRLSILLALESEEVEELLWVFANLLRDTPASKRGACPAGPAATRSRTVTGSACGSGADFIAGNGGAWLFAVLTVTDRPAPPVKPTHHLPLARASADDGLPSGVFD